MSDLDRLIDRQTRAAVGYLEAWMDDVLGEAQRIAPLDEGTLRGSASRETTRHGQHVEVVGYFSTPYAARQHEELGWQHPKGGQAKYLEAPFKSALPRLQPGLARAVAAVTR
jgi:hypothetical protein